MSREETAASLEESALELLREIVAVKCEPENGIYERAIVALYAAKMADIGMEVDVFEKVAGRPNVVGRLRGRGGGRSLLFNGHLNSPSSPRADWKHDPYLVTVEDGRIYGSGVADLKAAVAAMLLAARAVRDAQPTGDLLIGLGAASELGGLIGTKAIVERGIRADVAVVGEPTSLEIVRCQRGAVWCNVTITGKPGLTGGGVNAVHQAAEVIHGLGILNERLRSRSHPLLGSPELSVNMIEGGTRISTVPSRCTFTVDRRVIPGETCGEALAELHRSFDELRSRDPRLDLSVEVRLEIPPLCHQDEQSLIVSEASSVIAEVVGAPPRVTGIRGFTEMVHLAEAGIDAIVCGPGSAAVVHAPNEYVTVSEFMDAIRIYANLARRITCQPLGQDR